MTPTGLDGEAGGHDQSSGSLSGPGSGRERVFHSCDDAECDEELGRRRKRRATDGEG